MSIHSNFFEFLASLSNENELQSAYRRYKDSSFELNGRLKAGLPLGDLQQFEASLRRVICARSKTEFVLYRMTSRIEFTGPILSSLEGVPFRYMAYMSTSGDPSRLHSFTPARDPLVLRITCPAGTAMALMDAAQGASEDEYLLGCGTEFTIGSPETVSDLSVASEFAGQRGYKGSLTVLPLTVVGNPPYVQNSSVSFSFTPQVYA